MGRARYAVLEIIKFRNGPEPDKEARRADFAAVGVFTHHVSVRAHARVGLGFAFGSVLGLGGS